MVEMQMKTQMLSHMQAQMAGGNNNNGGNQGGYQGYQGGRGKGNGGARRGGQQWFGGGTVVCWGCGESGHIATFCPKAGPRAQQQPDAAKDDKKELTALTEQVAALQKQLAASAAPQQPSTAMVLHDPAQQIGSTSVVPEAAAKVELLKPVSYTHLTLPTILLV